MKILLSYYKNIKQSLASCVFPVLCTLCFSLLVYGFSLTFYHMHYIMFTIYYCITRVIIVHCMRFLFSPANFPDVRRQMPCLPA